MLIIVKNIENNGWFIDTVHLKIMVGNVSLGVELWRKYEKDKNDSLYSGLCYSVYLCISKSIVYFEL